MLRYIEKCLEFYSFGEGIFRHACRETREGTFSPIEDYVVNHALTSFAVRVCGGQEKTALHIVRWYFI